MQMTIGRWPSVPSSLTRLLVLVSAFLLPGLAAAQTGTVSGTVRAAATTLPVNNASVYVYTANLEVVGLVATGAAGTFTIPNVPIGNYFAVAFPPTGSQLLTEVHPDVECPSAGCNTTEYLEGTPFAVTSGGTVVRNFNLDLGGSVSGSVTNAATGTAVQNVSVTLFGRFGTTLYFAGSATSDVAGTYTVAGIPPGSYYAFTSNSLGLVNEVYDNIGCVSGCSTSQLLDATPITVISGATTAGRNFALDPGGRVSGTVTNATTGSSIQGVSVNLYALVSGSTTFAGSALTDATGTYTVIGLPAGTYYALTSNGLGFMNEIYDDVLCPLTCSPTTAVQSGAPIPVALGATAAGRNFALSQGGNISGTVLNQNTAAPLSNIVVAAVVRVGGSTFTTSASTNAAGNYTIIGLPTGTYRLYTSNGQGFINEIYDNQQCRGSCSTSTAATIGSAVSVTAGSTTTSNDFALQPGGSITGTITSSTTGLPVGGIGVEAYSVVGGVLTQVGTAFSGSSGVYTIQGLLTGSHFVATSGSHGWRNEAFDNLPCIGSTCQPSVVSTGTAVPVTVGLTTTGRNFALGRGDLVQGRVTVAGTGAPIAGATVTYLHSPSGIIAATATTGSQGVYTIRGLANGTYVAYTSNQQGFFDEIYNNIRCAQTCSSTTALAAGAPISVTAAAADGFDSPSLVLNTNFALDERNEPPGAPTNFRASVASGTAQFSWTAPTPGTTGVATSYVIDAGVTPGGTVVSFPVAATSHTLSGVPPGVYYVRVRAINAFGSSPPSTEVTLAIGAGLNGLPEAPTAVTAFMSGGRLTLTWSAGASGGPASSFLVEAGSVSGAANIATLPVAGRSFTFVPVPNGFYFLRVRAANSAGVSPPSAEVMIVVGSVASPPGAPTFTSHSVAGSTVTLSWQAPTFGTATSYRIEAGSATGLANLAVANTGNTNLTATFSGVPPGTFYVRIRAVNGLGASVVSNERTVVVP
jgi:hypothetical protein